MKFNKNKAQQPYWKRRVKIVSISQ